VRTGKTRFRVVIRVGRDRRSVTNVAEEWSSPASGGDRTRLTDHLAQSLIFTGLIWIVGGEKMEHIGNSIRQNKRGEYTI